MKSNRKKTYNIDKNIIQYPAVEDLCSEWAKERDERLESARKK